MCAAELTFSVVGPILASSGRRRQPSDHCSQCVDMCHYMMVATPLTSIDNLKHPFVSRPCCYERHIKAPFISRPCCYGRHIKDPS